VLDIATSATAEGKIQVARNTGERLPPGLVRDGAGRPITDPAAFHRDPPGAILPVGGHKGSGLSVFCEILAGSLTGGGSSHPANPTAWRLVNNMLTLAVDPARLGDGHAFAADVARLTDWVRSARPAVPGEPPLLPGEIGRWSVGAKLRLVAAQNRADITPRTGSGDDVDRSNGFALLDRFDIVQIRERIALRVGVNNVTDTTFAEHLPFRTTDDTNVAPGRRVAVRRDPRRACRARRLVAGRGDRVGAARRAARRLVDGGGRPLAPEARPDDRLPHVPDPALRAWT
jgi:hypothetical protein